MTISVETYKNIISNHSVVVDDTSQGIRKATLWERICRFVCVVIWRRYYTEQDIRVAKVLTNSMLFLAAALQRGFETKSYISQYQLAVKASDVFSAKHKKAMSQFSNMDNVVFALKCRKRLHCNIWDLIDEEGNAKSELLSFLKANKLHNVISKVNDRDKQTSILYDGQKLYIRAKDGESFLNSTQNVDVILANMSKEHPDYDILVILRFALLNKKQTEITKIQSLLANQNYSYILIKDIPTDKNGIMIGRSYLAYGIEEHDTVNWKELKPGFLEKGDGKYHLRIVTRLPEYSLEKTWIGFLKKLFPVLLNFGKHGHSWTEVVEPVFDDGKYTGMSRVYNVGYYFRGVLKSIDHMAYIPLNERCMRRTEEEITLDQFGLAKKYIETVNQYSKLGVFERSKYLKNSSLSEKEIENVKYLYETSFKGGTCLAFANEVMEVVTGKKHDYRWILRKAICPKKYFRFLNKVENVLNKIFIFNLFIYVSSMINRAQLPHHHVHDVSS